MVCLCSLIPFALLLETIKYSLFLIVAIWCISRNIRNSIIIGLVLSYVYVAYQYLKNKSNNFTYVPNLIN